MKLPSNKERSETGYALMEALIAAAIMALVVTTSSAGLRIALRSETRLAETRQIHDDLENILAQAKAGIALPRIEEAYPSYSLTLHPMVGLPAVRPEEVRPTLLTVSYRRRVETRVQSVILRTELELSR